VFAEEGFAVFAFFAQIRKKSVIYQPQSIFCKIYEKDNFPYFYHNYLFICKKRLKSFEK